MSSFLRSIVQTLSGQNAEEVEESTGATRPGAESRRQAASPAPAAAGGSPLGPADQQRDGHSQRQRRLMDRLAEASGVPLPSDAPNEQQEVEQEVPALLTVTVCDKHGNPMAAKFTKQHVADLMDQLRSRELFEPLRLGEEGGLTAADFYAACVMSVTTSGKNVGFDFVVDGPSTHRLVRLELLAARAGRPGFPERLNPNPFNESHYEKPSSALSNGAAKLFAQLWRHDNRGRQQKVLCADLAAGHEDRAGASAASLNNILLRVYKEEYNNNTPSKAPRAFLREVEEHQPAALDPLTEGPEDDPQLFAEATAGQLHAGQQLRQPGLPAGPAVVSAPLPQPWDPAAAAAQLADPLALIAALQNQLNKLVVEVIGLRQRVETLELQVPAA